MAVFGQNWEENNFLRHQNISAPLDGMYASKTVNKTLLEVSSKIGDENHAVTGVVCEPIPGPWLVDSRPRDWRIDRSLVEQARPKNIAWPPNQEYYQKILQNNS